MKNNLCTAILILFSLFKLNGQTIVKTYYDFQKTKVKESYMVNSKGEKNGQYKFYSEYNGVLREEVTFVNGIMSGVYKSYDVSTGKALLEKSETYKNEVKNGPAIYYSYGDDGVGIPTAQGNYVNNEKDGVWIYVDPVVFDTQKGFQYFKYTQTIKNGVLVAQSKECQYYPSNKKYSIETVNENGSETKYFYPNGNLRIDAFLNKSNELINRKEFYDDGNVWADLKITNDNSIKTEDLSVLYQNGKLKEHSVKVNGVEAKYEGYNEDGSKSEKMVDYEKRQLDNQNHKKELEEDKKNREKEKKAQQEKYDQIKTVNELRSIIESKNSQFQELYVREPNINSPVRTYPKGKHLYEKSDYLLSQEYKQPFYNEENIDKKIAIGNNAVKLLDKLISLASTDTKELNKQLKKAQTTIEIKQLLGL